MSLASKMTSDILVTTIFKLSLKIRGIVFIPLLTIFIGVAEYGAYVQVNAIASLVALICLLGLDDGFTRFIHETDRPAGLFTSLSLLVLAVGTIGGLIIAAASELLAQYTLQSTAYTTLFVLGGVYTLVHALFVLSRSYYRARRWIKIYSAFEVVDVYISVGTIAAIVLLFDGSIEQVFATLVGVHALLIVLIYADIARRGGLARPTTDQLRPCLRFSVGAMGDVVSGSLLHKIDRVLIGFFLGAGAVGTYSVAYSVGQLIKLYHSPINISFFPEFSKLWVEEEFDEIQRYMNAGVRYVAVIGIPSIAGFALVGEDVLNFISTAEVAAAGYIPLLLIATGILCRGIGSFYSRLFFASGNSRIPFVVQSSTVFVNGGLNVVLIPIAGIVGAALTTLVSFVGAAVTLAALFQSRLATVPEWRQLSPILLAAAGMFAVFWAISLPWPATVTVAPIVYFGLLYVLGGIEQREIELVLNSAQQLIP